MKKGMLSRYTKQGGACFLILCLALLLLAACGESDRTTPASFGVPTAPPTPANYNGVPDAVTVGSATRQPRSGRSPSPVAADPRLNQPAPTPTVTAPDDEEDGVGGPGERIINDADPTALAKLFGTPGPGYQPGGSLPLTAGPRRSGQASRAAPTPTLNTNPGAVRIESLRTTQVTFLTAYRQATVKVVEASRSAKVVFASANILKPERTVWSFLFVAPEGPRMWRVIYDSEGSKLDLREVAPSMVDSIKLIDMSKVLDSPALVEQAGNNGLNVTLPVDIISFQVEGLTKQPCFIFTNVAQGKQVAIHAYTGQVLRNDFTV